MLPLPPGPPGSLLAGSANEFKDDSLGFFEWLKRDYGNVVPFRVFTFPCLFLNEPDLINEVLVSNQANFTKDAGLKNNRVFFGNGLLSSEGDLWKKQRRLASPAFSPRRLEPYGQVMIDYTLDMLKRWQDGATVDIEHEMMNLTLRIASKTLFDLEMEKDSKEFEDSLTRAGKLLGERMSSAFLLILPESIPFPTNVHLHKAVKEVDTVIYDLIEKRRGNADERSDLLSLLIASRDEDGTSMSEKQIRDEVFTLFFAGHETTALTLTWTLYLLSQNPDAERLLVEELEEVLAGKPPAVKDYSRLKFTEKVIKESMRLKPPVWALGREAAKDCTIGNYQIKKGTSVMMSQWVMHHDEKYFEDPLQFKPGRWTPEFTESLPKFAYFPFGGGPRICIGNSFAMLEAVLLLSMIVQSFELKTEPGLKVEMDPAVTLKPVGGIKMSLHKRANNNTEYGAQN